MAECQAREHGTQEMRPVKMPRKDVPHYVHAAAVVVSGSDTPTYNKVLLAKRPAKGLLGGMWEFPNGRIDQDPARELTRVIRSGYSLGLRVKRKVPLGIFQHGYTHFKVTVHAFVCELSSQAFTGKNLKWVKLKDLDKYPMGKIDRQIADALLRQSSG